MSRLINILKNDTDLFILIGAFGLFYFVNNTKTYIISYLLIFIFLFLIRKKQLIETLYILLLIAIPFENNIREWVQEITPPLYKYLSVSGYSMYFGINVKMIIAVTLFLLFFFKKKGAQFTKAIFNQPTRYLLFFYIITVLFSLSFEENIYNIFIGVIRIFISIWIYILSIIYFQNNDKKMFIKYIISLTFFCVLIGSLQLIKQRPSGKFIELTPNFSINDGYSTTDGIKQFRVNSFISHPVYFGSFISMLLPLIIGFTIYFRKNKIYKNVLILLTILTVIVALATQSRTVWINLIFIAIAFSQKYINKIKTIDTKKLISFVSFIAVVLLLITFNRLTSLKDIFSTYGNGSIRIDLIKQSLLLTTEHPIRGVGLNNFTIYLTQKELPHSLHNFIVPVHNTFFLFLTEIGILPTLFFIFFIISSFKNNLKTKNIIVFSTLTACFTFIISSQFHPLFNLDPSFDLFMFIMGYLNANTKS